MKPDLIDDFSRVEREIIFLHIPVPKKRSDDDYFSTLQNAQVGKSTKRVLGQIHHDDEEGDQLRIKAAGNYIKGFGIATYADYL